MGTNHRQKKRKWTGSTNDQMHPRNLYFENPPDFSLLASKYPEFRTLTCKSQDGKIVMDWKNPAAVRELTRVLLISDFKLLDWHVPLDRLCPPIPNRLNYIHWIEDLIAVYRNGNWKNTVDDNVQQQELDIRGVDIGTGASCIYPLLGTKLNLWYFLCTDIDKKSLEFANDNIRNNHLDKFISTKLMTKGCALFDSNSDRSPEGSIIGNKHYDFCMCNPPFFDDYSEADSNPENCCKGSLNEMTTPGGEVNFISQIIEDSIILHKKITWYTSLIGRKGSIRKILSILRERGIKNVRTTEFFQGRTIRWGIAWSFYSVCNTQGDSKHAHKVLARKREGKRKNSLDFTISIDSLTKELKSSYFEIEVRIENFMKQNSYQHEFSPSDLSLRSFPHKVLLVNDSSATNPAQFHCTIILSISQIDVKVGCSFKSGDRSAFWIFAEKLKSHVTRSGRKWRRINKDRK